MEDDLFPCLHETVKDILTCLDEDGILSPNPLKVYLVYQERIGADKARGIPGQIVMRKERIKPSPRLELNTKFYIGGGDYMQKLGHAKLNRVLAGETPDQGYTREQIEGADYIEIDGGAYDLVDGALIREPNGFFWEIIVKRREDNRMTGA